MKTTALFLFLTASAWSFGFAQSTRDVPTGNFNQLTLQGNLRVELTQGAKPGVQIVGTADEIAEITTSTSGDELTIKTKRLDLFEKNERRRQKGIRVLITYQALEQIHTGRGAEVVGKSVLNADDLELEVHSGSTLTLEVQTTNLNLEVAEGALATLSGKTTVQKTLVSTGAELKAAALESEIVNIRTNTGATAVVAASKSLDASAGTGGNIRYKGRPAKREVNASLGGTITQL